MSMKLISSRMAPVCCGRRLVLCGVLWCMWAGIAAHTQTVPQVVWAQTDYTGEILAYSPTQPVIAVAGKGFGEILLLQPNGTVLQRICTGEGELSVLTFSPNGNILASAGASDDTIKLWDMIPSDADYGLCLQTLTCPSYVRAIAFSPDGTMLASGGAA